MNETFELVNYEQLTQLLVLYNISQVSPTTEPMVPSEIIPTKGDDDDGLGEADLQRLLQMFIDRIREASEYGGVSSDNLRKLCFSIVDRVNPSKSGKLKRYKRDLNLQACADNLCLKLRDSTIIASFIASILVYSAIVIIVTIFCVYMCQKRGKCISKNNNVRQEIEMQPMLDFNKAE